MTVPHLTPTIFRGPDEGSSGGGPSPTILLCTSGHLLLPVEGSSDGTPTYYSLPLASLLFLEARGTPSRETQSNLNGI